MKPSMGPWMNAKPKHFWVWTPLQDGSTRIARLLLEWVLMKLEEKTKKTIVTEDLRSRRFMEWQKLTPTPDTLEN